MGARLELISLNKSFGGKAAVSNVSFKVDSGEILVVLGENGAGKSTLMSLIYGLLKPDLGAIVWQGKEIELNNPADARKAGIGFVMQHFSVFQDMTVIENLYLYASLSRKTTFEEIKKEALELAEELHFELRLTALVSSLSVGEQQRLEILRCLLQKNLKLLILDEPTAVLSADEADFLAEVLRLLAQKGCSVLYITHKLREVSALADRVVVMRQGCVVAELAKSECDQPSLISLMMGDNTAVFDNTVSKKDVGPVRLQLNKLSTPRYQGPGARLSGVDIKIHSSEIIGIGGVSGSGQNAFIDALSGEHLDISGDIFLHDSALAGLDLAKRYRLGLSVIAAERKERSVSISHTLSKNYYLKSRLKDGHAVIDWQKTRSRVSELIDAYSIRCNGESDIAANLSGGNLQKFIVGREISLAPDVLICHQPTWGVDIRSANFIWSKLKQLAAAGTSIIVISEDIEEIMAFCDRVAAFHNGFLSPVKAVSDTSIEELGVWISGAVFAQSSVEAARV